MATQNTKPIPDIVSIKPANLQTSVFGIVGLTPLVQNKFSAKARAKMMATQAAGSTAKSKTGKVARVFDEDFEAAKHRSEEGWVGIPAPAIRAAMISACRLVGIAMTKAKLSVFVLQDGYDVEDGTPLIRLNAGEPERHECYVRNATGVADIRVRPMWRAWSADITLRWDADQLTLVDVANLLDRAGLQVGIGEGRADSKKSTGMGWGSFKVK